MRSSCDRSANRLRALAAAVCLALVAGGGDSEGADRILERVQKRYDGIRDVRARFEQHSLVASLGREDVSRGTVVVQRPGRMRWEYEEPERNVIVIDEKAVSIYSPADAKLQIAPLDAAALSPTALGFLLGGAVLRDTFRAEFLSADDRPEIGLRLVPREAGGFEALEIWLEPDAYRLRESVLIDLFGNRTRLRFDEISENQGVAEGSFAIRVPDDTEVIDLR